MRDLFEFLKEKSNKYYSIFIPLIFKNEENLITNLLYNLKKYSLKSTEFPSYTHLICQENSRNFVENYFEELSKKKNITFEDQNGEFTLNDEKLNDEYLEIINLALKNKLNFIFLVLNIGKFQNENLRLIDLRNLTDNNINTKNLNIYNIKRSESNNFYYLDENENKIFYEEFLSRSINAYLKIGKDAIIYSKTITNQLNSEIIRINLKNFVADSNKNMIVNFKLLKTKNTKLKLEIENKSENIEEKKLHFSYVNIVGERENVDKFENMFLIYQQRKKSSLKIFNEKIEKPFQEYLNKISHLYNLKIEEKNNFIVISGFRKIINRLRAKIINFSEISFDIDKIVFPQYWEKMDGNFNQFKVKNDTPEYLEVYQLLTKTVKVKELNVFRIQNLNLWKNYSFEKKKMEELKGKF